MTTTITDIDAAPFVAAVRSALSDLPPDELDELIDGLAADLAERAAESGETELGDPAAYAAELRAAAGYPPRAAQTHVGGVLPRLLTVRHDVRQRWKALLERHSLLASAVEFVVALRPVWWVFRGLAVYALLASMAGVNGITWWPVCLAAVVLSVQLGRGALPNRAVVTWTGRIVSAIAILAAPVLLGSAIQLVNSAMYPPYQETYYPQGLILDGRQVDNIFAYDVDGLPIDRVQLFDQNGEPLDLVSDPSVDFWGGQDGSMVVPSADVPGRAGWNVYPLAQVNSWSDYEDDGRIDESEVSESPFPFGQVKALAGASEQPAP